MIHEMWLPEDIARFVFDEDQFGLGEDRLINGNIIERRAPGFLVVHAEGRIALQSARRLHTLKAR
jgi:hypothetical protein